MSTLNKFFFSIFCATNVFGASLSQARDCQSAHAEWSADRGLRDLLVVERATTALDFKYLQVRKWIDSKAQRSGPFLTIVVPAFREAHRLPTSIAKMREFFDTYPIPVEILVVVEKSPDDTVAVGRQAVGDDPRIQVIDNVVQRGKGYAVRSGMLRAKGEYVLFMDADLSTPLPEVINFLNWFRTHPEADVVIGDRSTVFAGDGARSWHRRLMSHSFNSLIQYLSPLKYADTQAGFKAFRAQASRRVFENAKIDGFAFDIEILILAQELGYTTDVLRIEWKDDRRSTVHPVWDPLRMLRDVIKIRGSVQRRLQQLAPE